ncbi:phage major capsid protein [Phaeobacter gallaeciensis]|uniref:Phage major capsid protein n=1 Tax=Phaeobacter gallaeciensis TaxID=60890 RepID=A0A366X1J7_9RHOB|nr:phage major capsid protein [Phaeobacter gallaeciensis]RBW56807.1 phage major capsid protein [Phaeobacter gallaeciensis]
MFDDDTAEDRKARVMLDTERKAAAFDYAMEQARTFPQQANKLGKLEASMEALTKAMTRPVAVTATITPEKKAKHLGYDLTGLKLVAARFAVAAIHHQGGSKSHVEIARDLFGQRKTHERAAQKAATSPASTTAPGFATELVRQDVRAFINDMSDTSVFAQLAKRGTLTLFNGADSLTWPRRHEANRGTMKPQWIEENAKIPVLKANLTSALLQRFKLAAITTCSNELLKVSNPDILPLLEGLIRQDMSEALDGYLLDPALGGVVGVQPPSVTNGAPSQASAGNDLTSIVADFRWLLQQASNLRMVDPVVLMHSDRATGLQMVQGTADSFPLRAEVAAGSLFGLPILTSPYAPSDMATIVDASVLKIAADEIEVDAANAVTLEMSDDPENDVAPKTRSMFQTDATALRLIAPMSWALVAPRIAYLSGVAW